VKHRQSTVQSFSVLHALLCFGLLTLTGCGYPVYFGAPFGGTVVDEQSGTPVENASVVAYWRLSTPTFHGYRFSGVLAAKETTTDQNGHFHFDSVAGLNLSFAALEDTEPRVIIFKAQYQPWYEGAGAQQITTGIRRTVLLNGGKDIRLPRVVAEEGPGGPITYYSVGMEGFGELLSGCRWKLIPNMLRSLDAERRRLLNGLPKTAAVLLPDASRLQEGCASLNLFERMAP
jgi:hypothetical protein